MNKYLAGTFLSTAIFSALTFSSAWAQVPMQQNPTHLDANSFVAGGGTTAADCTTSAVASASNTFTITPPSNQSVYIGTISVDTLSQGTAAAGTFSVTNLGGGTYNFPIYWGTSNAPNSREYIYPQGLKSATPGTAVVVTPAAAATTSASVCITVTGWYGN
jgi:hypothetical protein